MGNGESSQIEPSGFSCKLWSTFYGFSSGHVWMWELDHKECWVPKNWCFQTVVLEKTLESPLDRKEIKPVNPKGNQPWVFTGRTDAEAETPILWPFYAKSQLIGKDPDAGKDWRQEEKGMTEDETVGWHHQLNGHEFEQTSRDGEGQGGLACCSPRGHEELHMTQWLNSNRDAELWPTYQSLTLSLLLSLLTLWFSTHVLKTRPCIFLISVFLSS